MDSILSQIICEHIAIESNVIKINTIKIYKRVKGKGRSNMPQNKRSKIC